MKITVQLTPEDLIAAQRTAMRPRPLIRYLLGIIVILNLLFIGEKLFDLARGQRGRIVDWWMVLAYISIGVGFFVLGPRSVRKTFQQQKGLQRPYEVEFGDTHLTVSSTDGSSKLAWDEVHKWKQGKKCLLIFPSGSLMHLIPWRAFASEADRETILRLLESKLGPAKP